MTSLIPMEETGAARTAGRLHRAGRLGLPLDDLEHGRMGEADRDCDLAGGRAALDCGPDRVVALALGLDQRAARRHEVVTAEHYLYAFGDYTEADYAAALAR
jgi:hypothetical protein